MDFSRGFKWITRIIKELQVDNSGFIRKKSASDREMASLVRSLRELTETTEAIVPPVWFSRDWLITNHILLSLGRGGPPSLKSAAF